MGRLYCNCLNVVVSYTGDIGASRPIKCRELGPTVPDHLLDRDLLPIKLDIAGIISGQPSLVRVHRIGNLWIHSCSNCSTDVYAVKDKDLVYVFDKLQSDPTPLKEIADYSPVYNIVLNREQMETRNQPSSSGGNIDDQDDPIVKLLTSQMEEYLDKEEQNMKKRIRNFEEKEKEKFKKLKAKAIEERKKMIYAINCAKETESSDKTSLPFNQKNSFFSDSTFPSNGELKKRNESPLLMNHSGVLVQKQLEMTNEDDMFNFDEELIEESVDNERETDITPFPQSSSDEDYESSSNSSSLSSADDKFRNMKMPPSSLPLSVPFLANRQRSDTVPMKQSPPDPKQVALSIQKLALSVQDTGLFGALPKPRVNSHR